MKTAALAAAVLLASFTGCANQPGASTQTLTPQQIVDYSNAAHVTLQNAAQDYKTIRSVTKK